MKPALLWEVGCGPESPWGRLRASVIGFAFRSSVPRLAPPAKRQRRCVQGDDPRCSAPSGSGSGMATLCVALDWARTFSVCGSWKWRVREHARARPARLPGLARLPEHVSSWEEYCKVARLVEHCTNRSQGLNQGLGLMLQLKLPRQDNYQNCNFHNYTLT